MKAKTAESNRLSSRKQKPTTKKGRKAKVKKVMDEWKEGELKTNAGKIVKDQKQAIAIALSESGQSYKKGKIRRKK
jgi:hypothetical protein